MSVTITINGKSYQAEKGEMIIEVADRHNIPIPRFCYHKRLTIAANCRMCLVDVEKMPKTVPACATPVNDGMVVSTTSEKTQLSQKAVMEFLLINHPLDCPICDQGGECELQDLAMQYGTSQSTYLEGKRVAKDFDLGPLVSTDMTRCIHCTRCIRFGSEIAGIREMGATSRGESMQVGTYLQKNLSSEISANIIDICPVGALTSKPHRSKGRTWELHAAKGVSFLESFGSNVLWHHYQQMLRRIVPRESEELNHNWIADKDRYSLLGIYNSSRLDQAYLRQDGQLQPVTTPAAIDKTAQCLMSRSFNSQSLCGLINPSSTFEEAFLFQKLLRTLGSNSIDHRLFNYSFDSRTDQFESPTLPYSLNDLTTTPLLIIGNGLDHDEPMLTYRLRQAASSGLPLFQLGWSASKMNIESLVALKSSPDQLENILSVFLVRLCQKRQVTNDFLADGEKHHEHLPLTDQQEQFLEQLLALDKLHILLAPSIHSCPFAQMIHQRSVNIASLDNIEVGTLLPLHSVGCTLAKAYPAALADAPAGLAFDEMEQDELDVLILFDVHPQDVLQRDKLLSLINRAKTVIGFYSFKTPFVEKHIDIVLPLAVLSENEGHHINAFATVQFSQAAHRPWGQAKQGWRLLKALADNCQFTNFEAISCEQVFQEGFVQPKAQRTKTCIKKVDKNFTEKKNSDLYHIHQQHGLGRHELLRQSEPLQQTDSVTQSQYCWINPKTAQGFHLSDGDRCEIVQDGLAQRGVIALSDELSLGVIQTFCGQNDYSKIIGHVQIRKVS